MLRVKLYQGGLVASIVLLGILMVNVVPIAAQQADTQNGNQVAATVVSASGTVGTKTVNGKIYSVLQDGSGKTLYYLEVGPRWFYANNGKAYPLDQYANQQVQVSGEVEQPRTALPSNANPRAKANKAQAPAAPTDAPTLAVYTINGQTQRGEGRPPWAGGPKNVPGHPGKNGTKPAKP